MKRDGIILLGVIGFIIGLIIALVLYTDNLNDDEQIISGNFVHYLDINSTATGSDAMDLGYFNEMNARVETNNTYAYAIGDDSIAESSTVYCGDGFSIYECE